MKVVGVAGWSGSGKTRLVTSLVRELVKRGLRVSTMKHAHASFDIDHEGKDSHAHREAGAHEVLVASEKRWALMHECSQEEQEDTRWLSPAVLMQNLAPAEVLLVEGFKTAPIDKIEVVRHRVQKESSQALLAASDPRVRAITTDTHLSDMSLGDMPLSDIPLSRSLPVFDADETGRIVDFILASDFFLPPRAT